MKIFLLFGILFQTPISNTQTTLIPDVNFELKLIELGYDTGAPNGSVLTANINNVQYLQVSYSNISDLTGIEDFISLIYLDCDHNQLTSLDLTNNTELTQLDCGFNQLTNLDVTNNTLLTKLICLYNQLTSLDVSQNLSLNWLDCDSNQLLSVDLVQNSALVYLDLDYCQLTSLNITQNTALTSFSCAYNQLTEMDVTQNVELYYFACVNNQIAHLNVTQNTELVHLMCYNNQLTCLNVKNGNNSNLFYFDATSNPNLTCIEVDNEAWSTSNWVDVDPQSSFSTNCVNSCTLNIQELISKTENKLSKIVDLTGREIPYKKNTLMLYIYEDGTSERVFEFE